MPDPDPITDREPETPTDHLTTTLRSELGTYDLEAVRELYKHAI